MQNNTWLNKIIDWNYTVTNTKTYENSGMDYESSVLKTIYLHEMNRSDKSSTVGEWTPISSKISLIYASDYALSLGETALNYTNNDYIHYNIMKTGWMYIGNNDSGAPSNWEWTSSRSGIDNNRYLAWCVFSSGRIDDDFVNAIGNSARPVFYLTENIKITSGKGSITEPFILS